MRRRYLRRYRNPADTRELLEALSRFEDGGQLQNQIFDGWSPPKRRFRRNPHKFTSALLMLKSLVQTLMNVRMTDVADQELQEFKIYYQELEKQLRRVGVSNA